MARNLIVTTLACAAAIAVGYAALVHVWHPALTKAPTTELINRLFVENYVYGLAGPDVLVGSSLTQRLPSAALGPNFNNLALSGGSALTGLAIVVKSPGAPRRVLVEINKIDLGLDDRLLRDTFDEPAFTARRFIIALRKGYQPLSLLYGLLRGRAGGQDTNAEPALNAAQRHDVMAASARSLQTKLDEKTMQENVRRLVAMAAEARQRGITLALYEMPIEPALQNLPRPRQIRDAVRAALPPGSACWIAIRLPGGAHTYDGQHLSSSDATAAAEYLRANPACTPG